MTIRLLDLYCGAGGCTAGYQQAGFHVTGIDHHPQPHYVGDEFHQADALDYVTKHGHTFDIIHASPPCQRYSTITRTANSQSSHPDLIEPTRLALQATQRPYIIENVPGAPLHNPLMLCATMFGLLTIRHRLFETYPIITFPPAPCSHTRPTVKAGRRPDRRKHYHSLVGNFIDADWARTITGCHWMNRYELSQCIPPAYTAWLGKELKKLL